LLVHHKSRIKILSFFGMSKKPTYRTRQIQLSLERESTVCREQRDPPIQDEPGRHASQSLALRVFVVHVYRTQQQAAGLPLSRHTSRAHSRHTPLRHCGFGEADAGMNKRSHTKCSAKCEVRSCKKGILTYDRALSGMNSLFNIIHK
jgi:hypothetical protein